MSLALVVTIVCAFFVWLAKNGIRAEQAEWEARLEFGSNFDCRCCCCRCSEESSGGQECGAGTPSHKA